MDDKLILRPKNDTPGIVIDPSNDRFEIYGKSLPEDTNEFYDPVIGYIKKYAENPNEITEFIFNFEYYNSASVRKIVNIITVLEKIYREGNNVKIIWMYEETDEVMKENGEDFEETTDIPVELKSFEYED